MIDTDKYKGHTPAPWKALLNHPQVDGSCVVSDEDESNFGDTWYERILGPLWVGELTDDMPDTKLIADAPLLLAEVKRLREGLIAIQRSLIWDGEDRAIDGESITLEALVAQVEQVRSDITEMIE